MTDDVAEKLAGYRERGARQVKLGLTDIDGVIRGKYVSLEKFAGLLAKGGGFCDCVFGWDVADELYDRGSFTGWHTGFPDADYRLVVDTERWLPDEGVPYFIGEFATAGEDYHPVCPRSTLRRTLDRAAGHGLTLKAGFEYEFFVFDETPHSVREKHYRDLRPLTPGNFGYSMLRASGNADLFRGLMNYCEEIGTPLEGLHCETGPGVWEGALAASDASPRPTARRSSRPSARCSSRSTRPSPRSWPSGRWTTRARAATSTFRSSKTPARTRSAPRKTPRTCRGCRPPCGTPWAAWCATSPNS